MHTLRQFTCGLFLCCMFVQTAFATISIRVFSKDEGLFETNIAKPRFYIQNIGDEPISNFYYYYYCNRSQVQGFTGSGVKGSGVKGSWVKDSWVKDSWLPCSCI